MFTNVAKIILLIVISFNGAIGHDDATSDLSSHGLNRLFKDYWHWRLRDMPQFATFLGINRYDFKLDDLSLETYEDRFNTCLTFLGKAKKQLAKAKKDTDKLNLEVLIYELETFLEGYKLKGYCLPVNRLEGPQVDYERLFEWMDRKSYFDYYLLLERMRKIPEQFDQMISLMKNGVANNVAYPYESVNNLNETLGRFIVHKAEDSPFYRFFESDFPKYFTKLGIKYLQRQAKWVIYDQVVPAYEKLLNYFIYEYQSRPEIGVTTVQNGQEFYKQLIKFHTSTNLSAEEIHQIGLDEVERIKGEMENIIDETGNGNMSISEFADMVRNDPANFYNSSEELMKAYEHMAYDLIIPRLSKIFKNIPKAKLKIKASPDPDGPGAYYLSGSFDGKRPGVFYVNTYDINSQPKYNMMTLSLHEGNPGHHLQTSYSIESPDFPSFRRAMDDRNYGISPSRFPVYTYFIEGWALYAEKLGFDLDLYDDPLDRYGHYSEEMFRACRLVVDTGMHALNWTREEAIEFMFENTASTRHEIENEVDRYITWPGQALAYKMGQLRFSRLRESATERLGKHFDIKEFHDIVLRSAGPMDMVESEVNKWVEKNLEMK